MEIFMDYDKEFGVCLKEEKIKDYLQILQIVYLVGLIGVE